MNIEQLFNPTRCPESINRFNMSMSATHSCAKNTSEKSREDKDSGLCQYTKTRMLTEDIILKNVFILIYERASHVGDIEIDKNPYNSTGDAYLDANIFSKKTRNTTTHEKVLCVFPIKYWDYFSHVQTLNNSIYLPINDICTIVGYDTVTVVNRTQIDNIDLSQIYKGMLA